MEAAFADLGFTAAVFAETGVRALDAALRADAPDAFFAAAFRARLAIRQELPHAFCGFIAVSLPAHNRSCKGFSFLRLLLESKFFRVVKPPDL